MDHQRNVSEPSSFILHRDLQAHCVSRGSFADYFTVGCKTEDGFTTILVERGPGLKTKAIKTAYSASAGTAYITFDDVRVPVENTLGEEGAGLFVILSNFNHERFIMCCSIAQTQRRAGEDPFLSSLHE